MLFRRIQISRFLGTVFTGCSILPALLTAGSADIPEMFGSQLFDQEFTQQSYSGYNPGYRISVGDQIQLNIWGGLETSEVLTVDAQGNIFIPQVGPVSVAGVPNRDLTDKIHGVVSQTFQSNVKLYANLVGAQDIKIYVAGFVRHPGLVTGHSFDSIMYFLDQAGGVDPERGSYRRIEILHQDQVQTEVSLYDFLLTGRLDRHQLRDGDTLFVHPQGNTVSVQGSIRNEYTFELEGDAAPLETVLGWAGLLPEASHVGIRRADKAEADSREYFGLDEIGSEVVYPGDEVTVYDHQETSEISVQLTGVHDGPQLIILPNGGKLSHALSRIDPNERSNLDAVQLYRTSVARRQKENLERSLDRLENSILAARSATLEEARIRAEEAATLLDFIERAREVEFTGMVTLGDDYDPSEMFLEDHDRVHVPSKTSVVMIYGEVNFPNTQVHQEDQTVEDYIEKAGGLSPNANDDQIFLLRTNGVMERVKRPGSWSTKVYPGDEIFILPKVPSKNLQLVKEISGIIYQLALGARVIIDL